ncbi:1247_t:CDS:2 [Gigaspora margarita]|uniref:1247_t:CDS:1 n=1 Tax=Gigaspora margarita TaxID=4874 RepID=A0ABN7URL0_GIGMA|nr:1247_t:CDS:2 [Gigaspora margarita]
MVEDEMEGSRLDKLIVELDRWIRKGKKRIGSDITEEDKKDFGLFRENIKQERMIASLLEKPFNYAVVNKLLENQNNTRVLTCDPEKVKEKTKEFFQKQFRRRCFNSDALEEEWARVYAPLERVQEKCLELEELMIRKYKKNRLENRENLVFYMDGFLVKTLTEKGGIDRMEASWVQVDIAANGKCLKAIMITEDEWTGVDSIVDILKPFNDITNYIFDNSYSMISIIYPTMSTLQNDLLKGLIDKDINIYIMNEQVNYSMNNIIVFNDKKESDKDEKSEQIKFLANTTDLVK